MKRARKELECGGQLAPIGLPMTDYVGASATLRIAMDTGPLDAAIDSTIG